MECVCVEVHYHPSILSGVEVECMCVEVHYHPGMFSKGWRWNLCVCLGLLPRHGQ